MALYVNVLADV